MKKIKINNEDINILKSVLHTYPLMEENDYEIDKEAIKFNKELNRMSDRILKQL